MDAFEHEFSHREIDDYGIVDFSPPDICSLPVTPILDDITNNMVFAVVVALREVRKSKLHDCISNVSLVPIQQDRELPGKDSEETQGMDVDRAESPILNNKQKSEMKRKEIVAWLEKEYSADEVVQRIRESDGSRQGAMPLNELREWIGVIANLVSLLTDESAGHYGGGQRVTKAAVADFLDRGEQWVGQCKNAYDILNQKRENPRVIKWLASWDKAEMGVKTLRDKLKEL